MTNQTKTTPSQIELLAKAQAALVAAIDAVPSLSDDENLEYWSSVTNKLACEIADIQPNTAREWALKLSVSLPYHDLSGPIGESIIKDVNQELAA